MLNLMIVEDNFRTRRALKTILSQQAEINVIADASNGQEAIEQIRRQPPDVAVMDVRMPVMNGLEATRFIKRLWPQVRIVILSMYPDCRSAALEAGADAFIPKGGPLKELTGVILGLTQAA